MFIGQTQNYLMHVIGIILFYQAFSPFITSACNAMYIPNRNTKRNILIDELEESVCTNIDTKMLTMSKQ